MIVFFKERLVLLSVPKTGTTAYQSALRARADVVISGPPELKHATIYRYDRFFRTMFTKLFDVEMEVMAVVREPIDWLGSWYRYRTRSSLSGRPTSTEGISFDEFVEAYMRGNRPDYANVGSQARFLTPRPGGVGVTHLFKYEHQDKITDFLQSRLDTEIRTEIENTSPAMPLHLTPKTEERFRRKCAQEFALHQTAR